MLNQTDLSRALRQDRSDTILEVWVVPGSSRSEIVGVHDGALRVRVAAPPEKGRANRSLLKLLSGVLDADVALETGAKTRRKRVRISGRPPAVVIELLVGKSAEPS